MAVRTIVVFLAALGALTVGVRAASVPEGLSDALPRALLERAERTDDPIRAGAAYLRAEAESTVGAALHAAGSSAAPLLLAALLCGAAEGAGGGIGADAARWVPYCGVLAVTAVSAGDLHALLGLGLATAEELDTLGRLLLPTVGAAMAAGGFAGTAGIWQAATLAAAGALCEAIRTLLLPLVRCYVGAAAAGALLPRARLDRLADGLRRLIAFALCAGVTLFTALLTLSGTFAGAADRTALRLTKAAIAGAVPVVGRIVSDAAESLLAGAGAVRAAAGALGAAAVLGACLAPLLRLGAEYLLYRAAAFAAGMLGTKELEKYLEQLGGAFALVLGMTASCALLLLVALMTAAVTAVGG